MWCAFIDLSLADNIVVLQWPFRPYRGELWIWVSRNQERNDSGVYPQIFGSSRVFDRLRLIVVLVFRPALSRTVVDWLLLCMQ